MGMTSCRIAQYGFGLGVDAYLQAAAASAMQRMNWRAWGRDLVGMAVSDTGREVMHNEGEWVSAQAAFPL